MPDDVSVINLFSLGGAQAVDRVRSSIADEPHLVAYAGTAVEERDLHWLDIHHILGSKGN